MKTKSTLLIAIIITAVNAHAQTRVGFNAGATYANMHAKFMGTKISADYKIGFTAGIFADVQMSKDLSFQPSLNFTQKGAQPKDEFSTSKTTINYLEMPLNFVYTTGQKKGLFIGAGPALGLALGGTDKYNSDNENTTDKIKVGSGEDEIKPMEFSGNILAGYWFANGFLLSGGYNFGLSNLSNDSDAKTTTSYFSLKIGWLLPSKSKK